MLLCRPVQPNIFLDSLKRADDLKAKGVDAIACTAANDVFVMDAWGKNQSVGEIAMLADGNADFAKALGLELNLTGRGMGHAGAAIFE